FIMESSRFVTVIFGPSLSSEVGQAQGFLTFFELTRSTSRWLVCPPSAGRIGENLASKVRVISGKFKSRRLKATPPAGIRPTSDKLKETVFNILGGRVEGAIFLDGCAGMGGIGIEAISRGAAFVYFVDQSRKACQIIRENLKSLGVEEGFKILEMDLI